MKKAEKMKTFTAILALSLVFCASAFAQPGGSAMDEQKGMMPESMMQMCMPMMKQMMGQGMAMGDMMQMMVDMMKIQRKMVEGVKPAEQKEMMMDMDRMMEQMMSMRMGMMGPDDRLKCAEEWLHKAIDLHDVHLKDPKTATEASQMEMMEQMKRAYGCITGGAKEAAPAGAEGKETGKDPHGH